MYVFPRVIRGINISHWRRTRGHHMKIRVPSWLALPVALLLSGCPAGGGGDGGFGNGGGISSRIAYVANSGSNNVFGYMIDKRSTDDHYWLSIFRCNGTIGGYCVCQRHIRLCDKSGWSKQCIGLYGQQHDGRAHTCGKLAVRRRD